MKNKHVGLLIIGIALLIGAIVFLFNNALTTIVNTSCSHGTTCPMYGTIQIQTYISLALIAIIVVIGITLIFSKEEKQIVVKRIKEKSEINEQKLKDKENNLKLLDADEKKIYQSIIDAQGIIFQSDVVDKTGFDKVKVTRILDRLEGRQLIERRRRGMTNVVLLKN
ncbi:MAG: hypothetical protein NTX24_03715 [Candidatus Pacearchaeota archaeon]|nr:hypothetical protein [Candidatus Pacearchaeota archaeon]